MSRHRILDLYLDAIARIRATAAGTAETSYYPAIERVLNEVGSRLKPAVFCLAQPAGRAAGIPDFGLFEQPQFRRGEGRTWHAGIAPERGVVEVKGVGANIGVLIASTQVREKYLPAYGLVLATNLRQFRLLAAEGLLESFDLGDDEAGFWSLVNGARPEPLATRFADFLERCLLARAPLTRPADVAFFLASYARDALARLAERADLPALANLRNGMEQALGLHFDAREGEHLFRSTLVQTLFYGLFSAWIVEAKEGRGGPFNWRNAAWSLSVPVARFLFGQVATPEALEPLQIVPLLDAAGRTLERVDRSAFFAAFDTAQAVQYFYEPFLEFFDPELRKQLGVWYTPPEIVEYMVERVDRVLRSQLGVEDGLANPDVWVLDPCCGTGSFLVAVLNRISRTLAGRGMGALAAEELRRAATTRVVGFEIMTAPFVVAHWQVGQVLAQAGTPLPRDSRASIYLTNALSGWGDGEGGAVLAGFETLLRERTEANTVKRERPILVVLGNPPYNAFAGTSPEIEGGLVEPYKKDLQTVWGVRKFNLDDLYVRFFRIAERRIAETTGRGIVCYISNYSWLSGSSFVVMRKSLVQNFDRIWIENMHGDRKITEYGSDGRTSETIFAMRGFSQGIKQGVATALLVRTGRSLSPQYLFRDDINASKASYRRSQLVNSLDEPDFDARYTVLAPSPANRYLLRPGTAGAAYATWAGIDELSRTAGWSGVLEMRRGALLDHDLPALRQRIERYCDARLTFENVRDQHAGPVLPAARFDPARARSALLTAGGVSAGRFAKLALYPFDVRWCFHTNVRPVWNEPRPEVAAQQAAGNQFLVTRARARRPEEGFPCFATAALPGYHLLDPNVHPIPFVLHHAEATRDHLDLVGDAGPNLSERALLWGAARGLPRTADISRLIWQHVLAISYSPAWLTENAAGIAQGWPRVPLPSSAELLRHSAALGARVADLLDPDIAVPGVTGGNIRPELSSIAVPAPKEGMPPDWTLTAGWGKRTDEGVTMAGRGGLTARPYAAGEEAAAAQSAVLGAATKDVWLNETTAWRNVPDNVWSLCIGGYQVLKKWLSYREQSILNRALTPDEVGHFMNAARRLAALRMLGPQLDANFRSIAASHVPLPDAL